MLYGMSCTTCYCFLIFACVASRRLPSEIVNLGAGIISPIYTVTVEGYGHKIHKYNLTHFALLGSILTESVLNPLDLRITGLTTFFSSFFVLINKSSIKLWYFVVCNFPPRPVHSLFQQPWLL